MRLTRHEITTFTAILTLGIGFLIIQPASAAPQRQSAPRHTHVATVKPPAKMALPIVTPKVLPTTTTTVRPVVAYVAPKPLVRPVPRVAAPAVTGNSYGVTSADVVAWSRVASCEEGGNWHVRGGMYSGGLGISNTNWIHFSYGMGLPYNAADATPIQQIAVAKKINAGYAVPDAYGCAAW